MKLGRWLAKLPVSVSLVVGVVVNYVRLFERYPLGQKVISLLALVGHVFNLLTRLVLYVCLSSQFFPEHKFRELAAGEKRTALVYRCRFHSLLFDRLAEREAERLRHLIRRRREPYSTDWTPRR